MNETAVIESEFSPVSNVDKEAAFSFNPANDNTLQLLYRLPWNGENFTDEGKPYLVAVIEKSGVWYYVWSHEQSQDLP